MKKIQVTDINSQLFKQWLSDGRKTQSCRFKYGGGLKLRATLYVEEAACGILLILNQGMIGALKPVFNDGMFAWFDERSSVAAVWSSAVIRKFIHNLIK